MLGGIYTFGVTHACVEHLTREYKVCECSSEEKPRTVHMHPPSAATSFFAMKVTPLKPSSSLCEGFCWTGGGGGGGGGRGAVTGGRRSGAGSVGGGRFDGRMCVVVEELMAVSVCMCVGKTQ